jgi:hypothetical protein
MKISKLCAVLAAFAILTLTAPGWAADIHKSPPANFKKVSELVSLPDYLPGMGTLYVDAKTLPVGPFLGYDKQSRLVYVIYMVPLSDIDAHKPMTNLGTAAAGLKIDHTDMEYNPGHPGVEVPHYHIVQWLISHEEEQKRMK